MNDKNLFEDITQVLQIIKDYFSSEIFDNPSRFMAAVNDLVASDAKTVKHLLRIAICDLRAYIRLVKAHKEGNNLVIKHLEREMIDDYMIPPEISSGAIGCIAAFVGFEIKLPKPRPGPKPVVPISKPQPIITTKKLPPKAIVSVAHRVSQMYVPEDAAVDYGSAGIDPDPRVGNTIYFGHRNWRVLEIQGKKALLLSENIIEIKWYHEKDTRISWADCSLRRYLNDTFYDALSKEEQFRISQTKVGNAKNPWFGTNGGDGTADKIFLLSIAEVVKYFGDSKEIRKNPKNIGHIEDRYNEARIAKDIKGLAAWWWLRSPGYSRNRAAFVSASGALYIYGGIVCGESGSGGGVRPALWLDV